MTRPRLTGKRCAVIGLARTGLAAARFCVAQGAAVTAVESSPDVADRAAIEELKKAGVEIILGPAADRLPKGIELVIPSPGVSPSRPVLQAAAERGIPIMSEMELAARFTDRPIIAVTGTNGKTTTVTLINEVLAAAGLEPELAGNIGRPLIDTVNGPGRGPLVVEASSFQLEYTKDLAPRVAVALNMTPDHLDWHRDLEAYRHAKLRIFEAQGEGDLAVIQAELGPVVGELTARSILFGGDTGIFVEQGWICQDVFTAPRQVVEIDSLSLIGRHNLDNVMATVAVALDFGVSNDRIASAVAAFKGVEHRLELVAEEAGVQYFNDSKATNPTATIKALTAFPKDVLLLAGGRNKGNDFSELADIASQRARVALVFGEAAAELAAAFTEVGLPVETVAGLDEAVAAARRESRAGDVVLLSPACASFDMFADYEARGRRYKRLVAGMASSVG